MKVIFPCSCVAHIDDKVHAIARMCYEHFKQWMDTEKEILTWFNDNVMKVRTNARQMA